MAEASAIFLMSAAKSLVPSMPKTSERPLNLMPTVVACQQQVYHGHHLLSAHHISLQRHEVWCKSPAASILALELSPMQVPRLLGLVAHCILVRRSAGLHGQIWTIVPDKSRSKFLQAVPKPPHTGSDGALPLLCTGGLWFVVCRRLK